MSGDFSGLIPDYAVGELRAVRTFTLQRKSGTLHPLFVGPAWQDGRNVATCLAETAGAGRLRYDPVEIPSEHEAPGEDCRCGFYAYGYVDHLLRQHPSSRRILGVVALSGVVIAGTRGLRAQFARIEALWLQRWIHETVARRVAEAYPSLELFRDRSRMLALYPPTELDVYERPTPRRPGPLYRLVGA